MKNIDTASEHDWDDFSNSKSVTSQEESSLIDAFPELFDGESKIEASFELTRNLLQNAESDTGINLFESTELFVADISPELATELLKFNMLGNRHPTASVIAMYSKLMSKGQWGISAPLIFSSTGYLIDGQHRLHAVKKSHTCQQFIVIIGLPDEVSLNIDRGSKRNTVDVAIMSGLSWVKPKHTSTALFMQGEVKDDKLFRRKQVTTEDLIVFLEKYQEGIQFALNELGESGVASMGAVLAVIAKAYYAQPHKRERLKEFCFCLRKNDVIHGSMDNAALKFFKWLSDSKAQRDRRGQGRQVWSIEGETIIIQYCQNAVYHFLNERNVKDLHRSQKDLFPLSEKLK